MAWEDYIEENIKCGLVEFLILALLTIEDMYGYRIKTELAVRTNNAILVRSAVQNGTVQADIKQKRTGGRKKIQKLLSHITTGERVSRLCNKKVSTYFCRSRQSDKRMWFR